MCDMYETIFRNSLKDFQVSEGGRISGYCSSSKEVEKILDRLKTLGFAYCVRSSHIKRPPPGAEKRRTQYFFQQLQGNVHISFFGPPFCVESSCTKHCILGPKYYTKRQTVVPDHLLDHVIPKKKRLRVPDTKKSDCPAVLYIKRIRVYPGYAIKSESELGETKARVLRKLRKDMELPQKPDSYLRFYMVASPASQHTHSTESVEAKGGIHPLLAKEIQNLVQNGTTSVKVIKSALEQFVNNFFTGAHTPGRTNTTFYPSKKTIYTHIYRALHMKKPVFDRGTLQMEISPYEINSDEEIAATYHLLETSDSYSQQFKAREQVPETTSSCSQQLEAREQFPKTSNSSSLLLKAKEKVPETSSSYSQQLEAREQVPETTSSCSQQPKARERVPETPSSCSQHCCSLLLLKQRIKKSKPVPKTSNSSSLLLNAKEKVPETSSSYSQQLEAWEQVPETTSSCSQQLKAREHVPKTSNSCSLLLKAKEQVPETSSSYSQQLEPREHVPETSSSCSQQLKARERVPKTSNSYSLLLLNAKEQVPETSSSYSQQLQAREQVPKTSNSYSLLLKAKEKVPENSSSYSQQLEAREQVPETSSSCTQQLNARECVPKISNSYSLLLFKAKEQVPEASSSYSQQLKARQQGPKILNSYSLLFKAKEKVPETSSSHSQQRTARERVRVHEISNSYSHQPKRIPEISNNYSQQLEARELCEQISNLTYNCSNSEALQEVLVLLRDCARKLHLADAKIGQPIAAPSTLKQ